MGEGCTSRYCAKTSICEMKSWPKYFPKESWLTRLDDLLRQNFDNLRKEFGELKRGIIKC